MFIVFRNSLSGAPARRAPCTSAAAPRVHRCADVHDAGAASRVRSAPRRPRRRRRQHQSHTLVHDFVARTDAPTVADFVLYCELDQLEAIELLDLAAFRMTAAWLARIKTQLFHGEILVATHGLYQKLELETAPAP